MADTIRRLIQRSHPTCIPISNLVCENLLPSRRLALSPSSSSQQRSQTLSPPPPPIRVLPPFSVRRWPAHSHTLGVFRPAFRRFDARLPSARLRLTTPVSACSAPAHPSASAAAVSPPPARSLAPQPCLQPQYDKPVASIHFSRLSLSRPTDAQHTPPRASSPASAHNKQRSACCFPPGQRLYLDGPLSRSS
ncbi:hypothetical protein PaG_05356 [Moesziomyces aphidis]|uniref:Uncharacterized protein n=1 Tax=Moesziomyces aphidis TaxID=84754 RepID=W3VI68_MOEAP|nr:hypothetical protein PaG_05356 [Moesziomyces aphidis]